MASPLQRQLAVLAQLQGKAIAPAAEHFANQPAPAPPGEKREARFRELFPEAELLEHDGARCWRVTAWAPLCGTLTRQGYACPVERFGGRPTPMQLARLAGEPTWAEVEPARIVFIDTETTSLAGGSGTYTFLIGLGRFAAHPATGEPAFAVEQYFMDDYDGEPALVAAVDAALADADALVSYNGRAFDVPLLIARWRMQRRTPRFPQRHLDLLHYARKLWKLRLPGCGLGDVEAHIFGHRRLSDVDGSWVPRIYFDFIHGIRCERIVPVFDHHAQDIFSLAALLALLSRALEQPEHPLHREASDQWGLARLYAARGEAERALACHEDAILLARDEDLAFRLAMHLARSYRRLGRHADAVALWQARAPQARPGRLDPLVELAKHAEHTLKDFAEASAWVRRALTLVEGHAEIGALMSQGTALPGAKELAALNHRLARLSEKAVKPAKKTGRGRKAARNPNTEN